MDQKNRKTLVIIVIITIIAFLIRLPQIGSPLQGDEYSSLKEAGKLNGFFYYYFLDFWMQFGNQEWWLRLPSVIAGILTVPLSYWIGKMILGKQGGIGLALFAATSPFILDLSLLIRHYGFYLASAFLAFAVTLYFQNSSRNRRDWIYLGVAFLLLIGSQILGIILVGILSSYLYVLFGKWPNKKTVRFSLIAFISVIGLILILIPEVRNWGWDFLLESIGAKTRLEYNNIRGISLNQIYKLGWAFYVFVLGKAVYPYNLLFVIPTFLLCSVLILTGLRELWRTSKDSFALVLLIIAVPLLSILFIFEPLVPSLSETVDPKHIAMAWPGVGLLLIFGVKQLNLRWLFIPLLLINAISVYSDWNNSWEDKPDWRMLASWVSESSLDSTFIVNDGRSNSPIGYYFPEEIEKRTIFNLTENGIPESLLSNEKIIFISNDFQDHRRKAANNILREIVSLGYHISTGYVNYPLFYYELVRDESDHSSMRSTGQLEFPYDIYSLEFKDLSLPIKLSVENIPLEIMGAIELNPDEPERFIKIINPRSASGFTLISNTLINNKFQEGETIATIHFKNQLSIIQSIPIRFGIETQSWDTVCEQICSTVYQWQKRLAIVGQRSYAGSWKDFSAGLHAVNISFGRVQNVDEIVIEYTSETGRFFIWGITLNSDGLE